MRRSAGIERVNALTQHQLTRLEALNRLNYLIYTDLRARRLTCEMGLICLLLGRNSREKCRRHSFMAVPICWPRVLPAKDIRWAQEGVEQWRVLAREPHLLAPLTRNFSTGKLERNHIEFSTIFVGPGWKTGEWRAKSSPELADICMERCQALWLASQWTTAGPMKWPCDECL